ncbi:MAG: aminotransferase class V-fold PLP-dependent enzyme [Bacteroidetes bacterium]|nr:aminotransferase class V-fold PLP-dependent enzyme [Bacteroidota bacterium]
MNQTRPAYSEYGCLWPLDKDVVFLNHGSFGACPKRILDKQQAYRKQLEAQPVRFFIREMEEMFDRSRKDAARFVNAAPEDLVFVQNATTGVKLVEAVYDFPVASADVIVEAILEKVTSHTRIALIDHITSATALVQPVETIVKALDAKGVDTMIDGAHALGSNALDLAVTPFPAHQDRCPTV